MPQLKSVRGIARTHKQLRGVAESGKAVGRTDAMQDSQAVHDTSYHHMLAITLGRRTQRQEELGGVRVLARIGHGHHAHCIMLQLQARLLIVELASIDGVSS